MAQWRWGRATRTTAVLAGIGVAVGVAAATSSGAQTLDDFEQRGMRLGAFDVFSQVGVSLAYTDNVFAVPDEGIGAGTLVLPKDGDFFTVLSPQIRLQTDTRRHDFYLLGNANIGRYETYSVRDFEDYTFETGGRWDATRTFTVEGSFGYDNLHEDASDPDRRTLVETTDYERLRALIRVRKDWTRSFARFDTRFVRLDYKEVERLGADVNAGRDVDRLTNNLRIGYRAGRNYDVFVNFRRQQSQFDNTPVRNRNQESYAVLVGTTLDIDRLVVGEFSAGLDYTTFESDDNDDRVGFTVDGALTFTVAPTTTLGVTVFNDVEPSDVAGASARLRTRLGLDLNHGLSRRLVVGAGADFARDDFLGSERLDETYTAGVNANYAFNRYLSVNAAYGYTRRDSNEAARQYTENQMLLTLVGRY